MSRATSGASNMRTSDYDHASRVSESSLRTVVLLTTDDIPFAASRSRLIRESGFFRDMFSMPTSVEVEEYPIPMPINFQSMALLYDAMTDRKKISILPRHDDRVVSDYVSYLSLQDQAELLVLADRFDCVNVQYDITSALEASASKNAMELLRRSSEDNLVPLAKIAIRHRGDCSEWRPTTSSGRNTWWKVVRGLRPTWQLELTKLYWEDGFQLVDREEERPRMSSGRAYPRLREVIMRQTRRTYAQIADDFDPPPLLGEVIILY